MLNPAASCEATKQSAPMCAFCWPSLTVAVTTDPATALPSCARCAQDTGRIPKVPSFMWRDLQDAAHAAFH